MNDILSENVSDLNSGVTRTGKAIGERVHSALRVPAALVMAPVVAMFARRIMLPCLMIQTITK